MTATTGDVVVDTNVLCHAGNPSDRYFGSSLALVKRLLELATVKLCVDPGFNLDEAKNQSKIAAEYREHLPPGTIGYQLIVEMATRGLINVSCGKLNESQRKKLNQMIRNTRDRTFVKTASLSLSRRLVSNDFEDFQEKKRPALEKVFNISLVDADAAVQPDWLSK